jgi:hypothetical protein
MKVLFVITGMICFARCNAQTMQLPFENTRQDIRCYKVAKGKLRAEDPVRHTFELVPDSTVTIQNKQYVKANTSVLRKNSYLRKDGSKIFIITPTTRMGYVTRESLMFDFEADPGHVWRMTDSTLHKGVGIVLRQSSKIGNDRVHEFELRSPVQIYDSHQLRTYYVSEKKGIVGIEYWLDGKPYLYCFTTEVKSLMRANAKKTQRG